MQIIFILVIKNIKIFEDTLSEKYYLINYVFTILKKESQNYDCLKYDFRFIEFEYINIAEDTFNYIKKFAQNII